MMFVNGFQRWLSRYPTRSEGTLLILGVFFLDVLWSIGVVISIIIINPIILEQSPNQIGVITLGTFFTIALTAILEDLVFRIIPLTFVLKRWGVRWPTVCTLLMGSLIFGLYHGDLTHLASNLGHVLLQGVGGLAYGVVFIKFSHFGKYTKSASAIIIMMHLAYDFIILGFLLLISGGAS